MQIAPAFPGRSHHELVALAIKDFNDQTTVRNCKIEGNEGKRTYR